MKNKEFIDRLALQQTLRLLRTASDPTNFKILKLLPITTMDLQKQIKLTKMPLNKRINELESVGLLRRERYKGKLDKTTITPIFFKNYKRLCSIIMLNSCIEYTPVFNWKR